MKTSAKGQSGSAAPSLAALMDKFKILLGRKLDQAGADDSPQNLEQITRMMQTVILYEQGQARIAQRERFLNLRQAGFALNVKQAVHAEARQQAHDRNRAAAGEPYFPEDFDNTERIAAMRKELFKDLEDPVLVAECDAMLAKANADAGKNPDGTPIVPSPSSKPAPPPKPIPPAKRPLRPP